MNHAERPTRLHRASVRRLACPSRSTEKSIWAPGLVLSVYLWDRAIRVDCAFEERAISRLRLFCRRAQNEARNAEISSLWSMERDASALQESQKPQISSLWRSRHYDLRRMVRPGHVYPRHGADLETGSNSRPHRQRSWVFSRKLSVDTVARSVQKPAPGLRVEVQ